MSASERPRPDRKASTASGLEGDLRCESTLEALSACAGVRRQVDYEVFLDGEGVVGAASRVGGGGGGESCRG